MRPSGPRPDGPNDHEARPFRGERPGLGRGRDREPDWYGGRRPFGEGRGGERPDSRERFGGWHEEPEKQGGWDRERERRDWRSPDGERDRDKGRDGEERTRRSAGSRERSTRWDRDDRLDRLALTNEEPNERLAANTNEPSANSTKEPEAKPDVPAPSTAAIADSKASEPLAENKSAEQTHKEES